MIRIAIVDDHQIVIDGLKLLLESREDIRIVAEANSAEGILRLLEEDPIDILLTDIMMPEKTGFDLVMEIRRRYGSDVRILALSMSEDGALITKMIEEAKIEGYIPKVAGQKELLRALEAIGAGGSYFSREILDQYDSYKRIQAEHEKFNLTARELDIIACVMQHLSNKAIADKLFISERTVETHRKNIYRKTQTKGEAALIKFVKEYKILP